MPDNRTVLNHATVLDVVQGKLLPDHRVVIQNGVVERVEPVNADDPAGAAEDTLDMRGLTVMPGLCDAHVHVLAWTANLTQLLRMPPSYTAARTAGILDDMLMRGFTTVRDAAGADFGIAQAVDEGYLKGPRIIFCGHSLSPTGGHGDKRARGEQVVEGMGWGHGMSVLCDGVAEVRRACREEIRKGASHIKLMLSGGVASPTDRITNLQFSEEEVRAAVEEADMAGLYVMAHAYTTRAVNRALACGVRSLEHCNLVDESSIELFLKHDAFMVPTLVTYEALAREGVEAGLPANLLGKLQIVMENGTHALALAHEAGVNLAYGTDLLGQMHRFQLEEFAIRSQVQPPIDIIRAATVNAAKLFNEVGTTGVVAPGARADLLVVDGNPLENLGCLQDPEPCLKAIIKGGVFFKNTLETAA